MFALHFFQDALIIYITRTYKARNILISVLNSVKLTRWYNGLNIDLHTSYWVPNLKLHYRYRYPIDVIYFFIA